MTQEDKELLLKDLCARLPYGTRIHISHPTNGAELDDWLTTGTIDNISFFGDIKPYLRPMSSMTEDEVQEIRDRLNSISIGRTITKENFERCCDFLWFTKMSSFECVSEKMMDVVINYLNENMFDYRGLIPMGLALEAPENMYE